MADYFLAAREAMLKARRTIHFLNWAFEPGTVLDPNPGVPRHGQEDIAAFLRQLSTERPALEIRILCWQSALPVAATQDFFPIKGRRAFAGTRVRFRLDGRLPNGACHHQKALIIDDAVAFCGGGDIGPDRWDTAAHLDDDPRREKGRDGLGTFDSRHEVMGVVDGAPAAHLGELFRARWLRATGETLPPAPTPPAADDLAPAASPPPADADPWPERITPQFAGVIAGIARTSASWRRHPEVRENERLHLAAIAAARRLIYMENQYFTSPLMAEALAARLAEPDGPEVVLVSHRRSPSWFDHVTMDRTRSLFIRRLRRADVFGRLRTFHPVTPLGRIIIVHAKLSIIDDVLLRIGSANLNNRSTGFDTECDLVFEAAGPAAAAARERIGNLTVRLIAHWLGTDEARVEAAWAEARSLGGAVDRLRADGLVRLRPLEPEPLGPLATFIAAFHLGDPMCPDDSFRPWRREREMRAARDEALAALAGPAPPPAEPPSATSGPGVACDSAQAGGRSKSITSGA
ncbi:phospholipase D-like domain-containing protein [Caulobacter sp. KR2-114]|uniref:phospholipase D-like domain-containing protein n=1 Tax=Caulobacter sp. KR2-114 TaxID=3400912 RepID=UPI003C0B7366